jgi:hypothetical protein
MAGWLGAALLTAAVVAPAAFAVLPSRTLAGALVGRVLPSLFVSGALVGALLAALASQDRSAPRSASRLCVALGSLVAAACLVAQLAVAPRIERLRETIAGPVDALRPGDARRVAFGRLHAVSVVLLGVAMSAGVVAMVAGARASVGEALHADRSNRTVTR